MALNYSIEWRKSRGNIPLIVTPLERENIRGLNVEKDIVYYLGEGGLRRNVLTFDERRPEGERISHTDEVISHPYREAVVGALRTFSYAFVGSIALELISQSDPSWQDVYLTTGALTFAFSLGRFLEVSSRAREVWKTYKTLKI